MDELNRRMMNTPDLNKERLAKLKELFPDLFTAEGKLNPGELEKIVDPELVKETERFEFKWFGKGAAKRLAFTPSRAALVYDEKRSVNPEFADGNLIIEGENLETLKVLLAGYREKVKIIYIDPPYNTGNDFVYTDKWYENLNEYWESIGVTSNGIAVDSNKDSSGRFHSNWLSMIYTRLLVARQLLKDDGAIFISIDDNEMYHLRKVCNEVFGEENFIAVFPWKKRTAKSDVPFGVSQDFEWIVAYTKGGYGAGLGYERKYYQSDDYPNDRWRLADLTTQRTAEERPNSAFNMKDPKTGKTYPYNPRRVWGVTKDSFQEYYEKGKIVFPDDYSFLNITIPAFRVFESEDKAKALLKYGSEDAMKTVSTQLPKEVGMSEDGNKELFDLFNAKVFSFPKPTNLIKYFIAISNDRDDSIILDFFAGSGTTAQAVMELNYEDGGNRKYILVQIPELIDENSEAYKAGYKKISDITIERNKRVIERIEKEEREKNPSLFNQDQKPFKTGFKVYQLAKSNFPRVDFAPDPTKTEEENLALLDKYIQEKEAMYLAMLDEKNIFDEVLLKNGFMLNYTLEKIDGFPNNKVFLAKDDYKECLICMEMGIAKATLKELENHKDKIFVCLERALDTTMKWNLKHLLGDKLVAF